MRGSHRFPRDQFAHGRREEHLVTAAAQETLVAHFVEGLVYVDIEIRFQKELAKGGMPVEEVPDHLPADQIAGRVLFSQHVGLRSLTEQRKVADKVAFTPIVEVHRFTGPRSDENLHAALLDYLKIPAGRSALGEDHGSLRVIPYDNARG